MARPDDTTDKLFPPPENPNPDAPIPIGPSIRVAFKEHREHTAKTLAAYELRLRAVEARVPTAVAPTSILGRIGKGSALAAKATPAFLLLGEGFALGANALGYPQVEGPIRILLDILKGG